MVLQVRIIDVPVPPLPKRSCHFIQKLALCFVTEYMLPQALSSGRFLLPQFLLVSSLFTHKNKTVHCISCLLGLKKTIQEFREVTVKQLYLASDPKATVQPHKPFCDRLYRLPLPLFHTVVCQTSAWLLSHSGKKC